MRLAAPFLLVILALAVTVYLDDTPADADLVFINRGDVFTLDPQRQSYVQDFRMTYALYEGLVRWNNHDFTIEPAAAADLPEISPDRRTYRFRIRDDARWSNGEPVTAEDFAYSWMRLLLPETAADYSNLIFCIQGAEAFWRWRTDQLKAFLKDPEQDTDLRAAKAQAMWDEAVARFRDQVGVNVLGERYIEVVLERPTPYFLDLLCFGVCAPVYRPCVEGWDPAQPRQQLPPWPERRWATLNPTTGRFEQQHQWARPNFLISNGPYQLEQWRYKRDMRLIRNPHYHSPDRVRSNSVVALTIEDTNTRVLAYESGKLHWLSEVGAEYQADMIAEREAYVLRYQDQIEALVDQGMHRDDALAEMPPPGPGERRNIHVFPTFGTDFYSFNCRPKLSDGRDNPFHDARVRRAFVQSVDKAAIVKQVTRLNEPVATTLIPPNSIPGYSSPAGLPFDRSAARAELAEAGWIDRNGDGVIENKSGDPFPAIDLLWTTNTPRYKWISLELKSQWEQSLGVRVQLRGSDTKFYKEDLKQGKFMIARGRWYGDYGDPTTFLDLCKTGDGNNDRGYSNAEVDDLLRQASEEIDPDRRMRILERCEAKLFDEEVPILVVCQLVQVYMYEPGELKGLSQHPRLTQYLWQMEVDPR